MPSESVDGVFRAGSLIERIGAEDRVGDLLSQDTRERYSRQIRNLASRRTEGDVALLSPEILVRDLQDRIEHNTISRATARLERAASLFWLAERAQDLLDAGSGEFGRFESAYTDILRLKFDGLSKRSTATSGAKLKAFPDEAISLIEAELAINKSPVIQYTWQFVKANSIVGLRPSEWFDASLLTYLHRDGHNRMIRSGDQLKSSVALEVINAKQSSTRANGASRTVLLETSEDAIEDIALWLETVNELTRRATLKPSSLSLERRIFTPIARAIHRILKKAGWQGAIPTPYSTRHQAVANAKADGRGSREIAALFGHASQDTARRHYAERYSGYKGRSMRPAPESVLAVRRNAIATEEAVIQPVAHSRPERE